MAQAQTLTGLTPREAVADALHRCVLGIDSNDRELFESACVKDDSASLIGGPFDLKGWDAISKVFDRVFEMTTLHSVSNIRVQLKDENTAYMTAHAIAHHTRPEDAFKPEETSYTAGTMYYIDLVKDSADGLWKIKK